MRRDDLALGAITVIVGGAIALAVVVAISLSQNNAPVVANIRAIGASPAAATPPAMILNGATPAHELPVLIGSPVSLVSTETTWPVYENSALGLSVRFPPGWTYSETEDRLSVAFLPPGSDPELPSPRISITFIADTSFDPSAALPSDVTAPTPISIAGSTGRAYADDANALPLQATYVELPHRGGTLFISATIGPEVDLRPVLDQMLATLSLQP